jgi:hypothetical protein
VIPDTKFEHFFLLHTVSEIPGRIRLVDTEQKLVSTVAGSGICSMFDGCGVPGTGFVFPSSIDFDKSTMYITDSDSLRRFDLATERLTTIVAAADIGMPWEDRDEDGPLDQVAFSELRELAVLPHDGCMLLSHATRNLIHLVDTRASLVTTVGRVQHSPEYDEQKHANFPEIHVTAHPSGHAAYFTSGSEISRIDLRMASRNAVSVPLQIDHDSISFPKPTEFSQIAMSENGRCLYMNDFSNGYTYRAIVEDGESLLMGLYPNARIQMDLNMSLEQRQSISQSLEHALQRSFVQNPLCDVNVARIIAEYIGDL